MSDTPSASVVGVVVVAVAAEVLSTAPAAAETAGVTVVEPVPSSFTTPAATTVGVTVTATAEDVLVDVPAAVGMGDVEEVAVPRSVTRPAEVVDGDIV